MGYLDYAGLQYFWGKLKEKFAPKSHSHDDRYYTEAEVDGMLNSKVNNNEAGADSLLSKLTTSWTATPTDNTYFIRQDTGGGDSFGRVKFSTLWNYIKGKTDGVYQPKGNYSTTDTKNTAGSTNTTSKLYLIGSTSQSTNPQTYSNASVYTTGSTIYANGFGNDIFIIYPSGGSASYGGQQIGYCKITLPTLWDSTMMTFTVTIYNYVSNTSVDYRISGYNYSGKPWYNCAAVCVGKAGTSHSNLSVRFGDNGTKNVITIGEEDTEWEYPRIVVHDVVIGNSNFETYKSGWNVEISKSSAPNVSETISNTHVGYNAVTSWDKIQNKPSSFTPASHTHDDRYYTESEINTKLDGKSNTNHTHNTIKDIGDGRNIKFAYSKSGLNYGDYSWLAGWNDGELRAVDKNQFATAKHTHDISTLTGNIINTEPSTNNHKIVLGKSGLDKCEFYEYGGVWNFYKMSSGTPALVASIQPDGVHATLKGTADVANVANFAKETYINQYKTVNLTDLDQNTWYPVTSTYIPHKGLRHFKCNVQLNSGSKPNWSTHSGGFTAVVDILEESSGLGTTGMLGEVLINDQRFIADGSKPPVGYQQLGHGSIPVWWLRGGGTYFLAADYDCTWTIQKSKYENNGQSVAPTTTYPGVSVNRATITANLNGNASTAEVATAGVRDYNNWNNTIKIGWSGADLDANTLSYVAGYTSDMKIHTASKDGVRSWLGLGASAYKKTQSLSAVGHSDWQNQSTDDNFVPTMAFMAFWNGAFSGSGSSNLQYCDRGRFGTIVTKNSGDYAAVGHTHTKSQITDFPASLKNPTALTIQTNGTTAATYDGSAAKTVNITKGNIGLGNVDNTADANKSVKYATSAGNASKVNNHTVNIDVPANAKFTDTNTWRGIQNNLTSDSTDQSLSAAQGKALKTLVDGKAPISHTHTKSQITDFPTSMPASDVYPWAKAATKPSYTKAEVGLSNVDNTADKDKSVKYATSAGSASQLNGFTIQASTSDLTAGYSRLNNNVIYIVYE